MSDHPASCPTAGELERHALGVAVSAEVAEHLRGCEACRAVVEEAKFAREFGAAMAGRNVRASRVERGEPASPPGYQIVREISRGGQGVVYEATQTGTHRRVAIKILRPELGGSTKQVARFEREVEIAAALDHPWIVRVIDSMRLQDGRHAIIMELVEGLALDQWLNAQPGSTDRDPTEAVRLIAGVCDAVHYAHQRGVIHRDLKPSNILVDREGRARVLDFGVSTWFGTDGRVDHRVTMTGEFSGTLAYAAPEQVSDRSGAADLRSDVYSLGVLLHQTVLGGFPYPVDGSLETTLRNIREAEPVRPAERPVATDLWTIIVKALAKEPERRYQSAAALAADLRRYQAGEAIDARRNSGWYVLRKGVTRHRFAVAIGAVVAASLIAVGVVLVASNRSLERSLRRSKIEQARSSAMTGNRSEAEDLIWPEILRSVPADADYLRVACEGTEDQRRALWAFFEVQGPRPCLATTTTGKRPMALRGSTSWAEGKVLLYDRASTLQRYSASDLSLISTDALGPVSPGSFTSVSADGRVIAILNGSRLEFRALPAGKTVRTIELDERAYESVDISDNGEVAAVVDSDARTTIAWSGQERKPFLIEAPAPEGARFLSRSGAWLGTLGRDHVFRIWGTRTGNLEFESRRLAEVPEFWLRQRVLRLAVSEDRTLLAVSCSNSLVAFRVDGQGPAPLVLKSGGGTLTGVFSRSGRWLATLGNGDTAVRVWNTATWEELGPMGGHTLDGNPSFSPDDTRIVTTDMTNVLRLWEGPADSWRNALPESKILPHDFWIASDAPRILAAASDGRIYAWGTDGKPEGEPRRFDASGVFSLDRRGDQVFAGGAEGVVRVRSADGSSVGLEQPVRSVINGVRLSPGGRVLAVCTQDSRVLLLDAETLAVQHERALELGRLSMVRWSRDGRCLVVTAHRGAAIVLRGSDLSTEAELPMPERLPARCAEFSHDGELLATGGDGPTIQFWEVGTWKLLRSCRAGVNAVFALSFHPADRVLAVGHRSGQIAIVGVPEARALASFKVDSPIMRAEFLPDGRRLLVGPLDGAMEVWNLDVLSASVGGNRRVREQQLRAVR